MREYSEVNSGHGRVEERRIRVLSVKEKDGWKGVRQWCEIRRKRWIKGKESIEFAYAITSLPPEKTTAKQLLELNRGHWGVESMHWLKDTLLKEDASTIRTKNAPQNAAIIRNIKLFFINKINMKPKEGHEFLANNIKFLYKTTDWMK